MGDVVSFSAAAKKKLYRSCEELAQLDTDGLDETQLRELLETVEEKLRQLNEIEPADMDSDAYEEWADLHEQIEDLQDEILDKLDQLTYFLEVYDGRMAAGNGNSRTGKKRGRQSISGRRIRAGSAARKNVKGL